MKQQINLNSLSKNLFEQFEKTKSPLDDSCTYFFDLIENIEKYKNKNKHGLCDGTIDEYYLIKILKSLLSLCYEQKIDLNKYLPLFIES